MALPERLGRYSLGDRLGEGGMGVVYRAQLDGAEGFSRVVAVKRVHEALARDPGIRDAFVAEARTAMRLRHGNIVQVLDVGIDADLPYLVVEYVDGVSLAELLRARGATGPLAIGDALQIAEHVASALAYAHGLTDAAGRPDGVVHRDVTPRNILVSREGLVKLVDFGLAKALGAPTYTVPGTFKGTLGYVAPEQARGEPVDARADQFSTGVVLYEMLAGTNPLGARDVEGYHAALRAGLPPLAGAGLDGALAAIVARATALDPAARYPSMDELRAELEAWRVERKIRTSSEALRATVRAIVGDHATMPGPRRLPVPLEIALPEAGEPSGATRLVQRPARGRRRLAIAFAAGAAAAIAFAAIVVVRGGGADAPAPVRGAVPEAAATVDRAPAAGSASQPGGATPPRPARIGGATGAGSGSAASPAPGPAAPRDPAPRQLGRLRVNVMPWANVYLDNRLLGAVPVDLRVAAGAHTLVLHNPETGQRAQRPIRIAAGGEEVITSW